MNESSTRPGAMVSIHDVMPDTVPAVQQCLAACRAHGLENIYLLIVPGPQWDTSQIEQLSQWVQEGCTLVGHGWMHRAETINGIYHRLHSMLISRDVAEHLALDESQILALMRRCHGWFKQHDLPAPDLYVPPAWALGKVRLSRLQSTGFRYVETMQGIVDVAEKRWAGRALLGYEADTSFRAVCLKCWNATNRRMTGRWGMPRLSIHPNDLQLRLASDLKNDLVRYQAESLDQLFGNSENTADLSNAIRARGSLADKV